MGAWGSGIFENDGALDWVNELLDGADLDEALASSIGYLDADDGSRMLAAAEVVAGLHGHPADDLLPDVKAYIAASKLAPSKALARAAVQAVKRVLSPSSELRELWGEGDDTSWRAVVVDLQKRLSLPPVRRRVTGPRPRRRVLPEICSVLELPSPTGAATFSLSECDDPRQPTTQAGLTFRMSGSGLFMAMGIDLGITARWLAGDRLEISLPRGVKVDGPLGELETRIQNFDQVVEVRYRRGGRGGSRARPARRSRRS